MKRAKTIIVTKRDGTLERFSPYKLGNCVARAMRGRACDPRLAEPLTRAVALHLEEFGGAQPPTTNYIHRCICSVLRQAGLPEVADDLCRQRRLRAVRRRQVRVVDGDGAAAGEPWRKSQVVELLQARYGLRQDVCRFLAGQIEMQVFALNYRVLRRPFLAELVRSEVLAWGLADERSLQAELPPPSRPVATPRPEGEQ